MTRQGVNAVTPAQVWQELEAQRSRTLAIIQRTPLWAEQTDPDFSPVGWHLGHIGFTEALWLLEQAGRQAPWFPDNRQLWAADGLPKLQRQQLPSFEIVLKQIEQIRSAVQTRLLSLTAWQWQQEQRLWQWLVQHEAQHAETIQIVQALGATPSPEPITADSTPTPLLAIPAQTLSVGDNTSVVDNERPAHRVSLAAFWIEATPVSRAQYQAFSEAGGYRNREWWCEAGWQWLQQAQVKQPRYSFGTACDPVCGLSQYEAAAYTRFVGKRLPTESEWEAAARYLQQTQSLNGLGQVWQWTSSDFAPYPGFAAFPYRGYAAAYFDGKHKVLRGGSRATQPPVLHIASRNWYVPSARQPLAGLRCVQDIPPGQ